MEGKFEITFTTPPSRFFSMELDVIFAEISNKFGKWFIKRDGYIYFEPKKQVNERQLEMIKVWMVDGSIETVCLDNFKPADLHPGCYRLRFAWIGWACENHYKALIDASSLLDDANFAASCPPKDTSSAEILPNDIGIIDYFEGLLESGKLADITIKTAGAKEIKAHNLMLSRSKVFDAMLNIHDTIEAQEKKINIDDVDYDVMKEFLRFLYCGKIPKLEEMASELLALADRYEIKELVQVCGTYLIKIKDVESIADVLVPAESMKLQDLKCAAVKFAIQNIKQVINTEGWKLLKISHCSLALEIFEKYIAEKE